jgi:hypothetical protein
MNTNILCVLQKEERFFMVLNSNNKQWVLFFYP